LVAENKTGTTSFYAELEKVIRVWPELSGPLQRANQFAGSAVEWTFPAVGSVPI
jgi:hypothetical protein